MASRFLRKFQEFLFAQSCCLFLSDFVSGVESSRILQKFHSKFWLESYYQKQLSSPIVEQLWSPDKLHRKDRMESRPRTILRYGKNTSPNFILWFFLYVVAHTPYPSELDFRNFLSIGSFKNLAWEDENDWFLKLWFLKTSEAPTNPILKIQ